MFSVCYFHPHFYVVLVECESMFAESLEAGLHVVQDQNQSKETSMMSKKRAFLDDYSQGFEGA